MVWGYGLCMGWGYGLCVGTWTVCGVGIWTVHGVGIWTVCGVYLQYCRHQNLLMVEQLWEQEDNPTEMACTKIIRSYGEDVSHLSPTFFLSIHACTLRQYT